MTAISRSAGGAHDTAADDFVERVLIEMGETRSFLADWFAGRAEKPQSPEEFYLNKVLAQNFNIVRPNGLRLDRQQTLASFFSKLYGSDPQVLRHDNSNIQIILQQTGMLVMGYDESHIYRDHVITNTLTAVLLAAPNAPNGVQWQLVHETFKQT